jgi:hypothetical protein
MKAKANSTQHHDEQLLGEGHHNEQLLGGGETVETRSSRPESYGSKPVQEP